MSFLPAQELLVDFFAIALMIIEVAWIKSIINIIICTIIGRSHELQDFMGQGLIRPMERILCFIL